MSDTGLVERLSLIAGEEALEGVGARVEDLGDPDVRAVVIRADHPEFDRALREGKDELIVDGELMSIRLHLTMHQVLATQLADNDPPEMYLTAQRLLASGYERQELLHMLAAPIAEQIHPPCTAARSTAVTGMWRRSPRCPDHGSAAAPNERSSETIPMAATRRDDDADTDGRARSSRSGH